MSDLSERSIKAAPPGAVLRDADITGLHLRVFPQRKVYYLYYRTKSGVERRPKIGEYGTITLSQARKVAQGMLAKVASGEDPSGDWQADRKAPTLAEFWVNTFQPRHVVKKKSAAEMERLFNRVVAPTFGSEKLNAVSHKRVIEWMEGQAKAPMQANRALALLSKMFNFAVPRGLATANPCKGVERYQEIKRRRYMTADEARKIGAILSREAEANPASVAFIYLLIYTGARSGEISTARWNQLDGATLRLADGKTGARTVFLSGAALEILERLPRTSGTITGIKSPKKLWERVRAEAGSQDLRLHDLRHSFASAALSAGYSLGQIGELLGHSSTQTTHRYAHLVEESAAAAANDIGNKIAARMNHD
jgi:integrase